MTTNRQIKTHGLLIVSALVFFSSCNPKISTNLTKSYPPLDYRQKVTVIQLGQSEPDSSEFLGQVRIGDTGFSTKCGYDMVMDKAKLEARKAGGNAIKIIEHKPPTLLGSSCHKIVAKILRVENHVPTKEEEALLDVDHAILNVYRYSGYGALLNYDLYLGDSVICRVKNNFKKTIHIKKDGLNTLWAKTEAKSEVPINLKNGKTYYLRCGVTIGALIGRPKLELIDSKTAKPEFESFKAKNQ